VKGPRYGFSEFGFRVYADEQGGDVPSRGLKGLSFGFSVCGLPELGLQGYLAHKKQPPPLGPP